MMYEVMFRVGNIELANGWQQLHSLPNSTRCRRHRPVPSSFTVVRVMISVLRFWPHTFCDNEINGCNDELRETK